MTTTTTEDTMTTDRLDKSLWIKRPAFGVAGGPDVIVLSDYGSARAYSVGAGVRMGKPAEALEALSVMGGIAPLATGCVGKVYATEFAKKFCGQPLFVLKSLGYAESVSPDFEAGTAEAIRLTVQGRNADAAGHVERLSLLARIRSSEGAE